MISNVKRYHLVVEVKYTFSITITIVAYLTKIGKCQYLVPS